MRELSKIALASASTTTSGLARGAERRLSSHRKFFRAILLTALMVFVALVATVAWRGLFPWQRQQAKPASNIVSINLAADNLFCPSYAAWSPNGQQVAVLAQVGRCDNADAGIIVRDVVAIYDIRGHLVKQFDVDESVPEFTDTAGAQATATVTGIPQTILAWPAYWGLVWSRDGKRLALPFQLNWSGQVSPTNQDDHSFEGGVVLVDVDGMHSEGIEFSPFYGNDYWDLQTTRVIHRNSADVPLALAYQWTADGKLTAASAPSATVPVGNPSGGQSFTVWQPGTVTLERTTSTLNFGGVVTAWSPNGRYLMPLVGFGGELDSNATGFTQGSDGEFHLAPRDKGLMAAAVRLKDPADPNAAQTSVAWRADGALIVATDPNPLIDQVVANGNRQDIPFASQSVTIFDCATGIKLLTLTTRPVANRLSNFSVNRPFPVLDWNAAGDLLFFLDTNFDTLTIWNVNLK